MLEQPYDGEPEGTDRVLRTFNRLALLAAGLLLLAIVCAAAWVSFAHAQERIVCQDGYCVVPVTQLRQLVDQAGATQRYATMCNWPGFKDE